MADDPRSEVVVAGPENNDLRAAREGAELLVETPLVMILRGWLFEKLERHPPIIEHFAYEPAPTEREAKELTIQHLAEDAVESEGC